MSALAQTGVVLARQMRPTLRNPTTILSSLAMPLLYLALFGPLLPGLPGRLGADPWQWFVPGILVMVALSALYAGFSWLPELRSGAHERLLVAPISRAALLLGRVLRETAVLGVQALLLLAVGLALGLRAPVAGLALALAMLLLLGVGIAAASIAAAMMVREEYAFSGVAQMLFLPLLLSSGVFLPMDLAPGWLYVLSRANPVTHVVEAQRALFAGELGDASVPPGFAAAALIAVAAVAWGVRRTRAATG